MGDFNSWYQWSPSDSTISPNDVTYTDATLLPHVILLSGSDASSDATLPEATNESTHKHNLSGGHFDSFSRTYYFFIEEITHLFLVGEGLCANILLLSLYFVIFMFWMIVVFWLFFYSVLIVLCLFLNLLLTYEFWKSVFIDSKFRINCVQYRCLE